MKVFRFIFLLTNGILLATNSRAQTPVEIIDFLKKNLIIKYLGDPNTKDPKIETIDPEKIIQNTKGIVFGTKNNNKMDVNAQMVTSIYKDRASGKGGDGLFQDALYQILHLINKPA
ncbi:MAG TPA: hypothetical protein VLJ68_00145, partial [Chitinophagaceae bacterium]|nr:hypothetical protein [Chitinophagaceae bacterium]